MAKFLDNETHPLYDQAALDAAVAAERERCARLCEEDAERLAKAMNNKRRGVQEMAQLAMARDEAAGLAQRIRGPNV